jgi:hypothetical protein
VDRLESLTKVLEAASQLLDWAAQEIVAIPFEPKRAHLDIAVAAISSVSDLLLPLYELRPHLSPPHLRKNQTHPLHQPIYSPTNPPPKAVREELAILDAIRVLEGIAAANKNMHLTILAEEQLPKLRSLLNET